MKHIVIVLLLLTLFVLLTNWPDNPEQLEFHASDKDVECYAFCLPICDEDTLDLLDDLI